eukprot:363169-Chlamydomonas_euryale.AAC.27
MLANGETPLHGVRDRYRPGRAAASWQRSKGITASSNASRRDVEALARGGGGLTRPDMGEGRCLFRHFESRAQF